jgi:cytochrome c553
VPALVAEGDWSRGIAPCASCHAGPHRARLSPPLRGQPEAYLSAELHAYADGRRRTDTMGRMRAYAARLDEAEIARLAAWYADAPPRATSEVAAASDPAAPTDASGPSAEAAQPQGERP